MGNTASHPRRCTATRTDGEPCERWAILGASVCPSHGGSTGHVKRAAKRRLAEAKARQSLADVEIEEIDNPVTALRALVSETVALKSQLAAEVAAIQAKPNGDRAPALAAYERALDRSGRLLTSWVSLGLTEQWLRLSQARTTLVALALSSTLEELGLTGDTLEQAEAKVVENLEWYAGHAEDWMPTAALVHTVSERELEAASERVALFARIDQMAARIAGQPDVIEVEAQAEPQTEETGHGTVTGFPPPSVDPKTGHAMPDASKLDPPPPPPPEPDTPSEPRRRVRVEEARIPVLGEQYVPPWGGWKGAAKPPSPSDDDEEAT